MTEGGKPFISRQQVGGRHPGVSEIRKVFIMKEVIKATMRSFVVKIVT